MVAQRPATISVRILGTGHALPPREWTTQEIAARVLPPSAALAAADAIGIRARRWAEPGAPAAPLAAEALGMALARAGLAATDLRRVILATSTGADWLMPATAVDVLAHLGVDAGCDAFDVSNACVGFLSAFDVAARTVATGGGPVGVVAVELFSRYLTVDAPRSWLVMGDGAAACVLGAGGADEGLLATWSEARADLRGRMGTPHPGRTGVVTPIQFGASAAELTASAQRALGDGARAVLARAGVALEEVTWFLPHQPNGAMLRAIAAAVGVSTDRMVPIVDDLGSLGAAAIPMSLDALYRTRPVRPGDLILMVGVGSGTACSALLHRVGSG